MSPAHRASRRDEIVDAAIEVFAEQGYTEASLGDIADRAGVAVTALYYHFAGKDELFEAAMRRCLDAISAVVLAARPDVMPTDADALDRTIDAVWDWIDQNPAAATMVHVQLPGAVRQVAHLRQEFIERHEQRARGYVNGDGAKPTAATAALGTLRIRTLIDFTVSVHVMRLAGGPLSTLSNETLRKQLHRVARRLVIS